MDSKQRKDAFQSLLEMEKITCGRVHVPTVFRDFVYVTAAAISAEHDPGHAVNRNKEANRILRQYTVLEQARMYGKMDELFALIKENLRVGVLDDILGQIYERIGRPGKNQDFTPKSMGELMAKIIYGEQYELPKKGYMILHEPTCGSGSLLLTAAECLQRIGVDYRDKLVFCAIEYDPICAAMTFIQTSLYSMTGIVITGNTITGKEETRWFTPNYVLNKWIYREPFLMDGRPLNFDNEMLKIENDSAYKLVSHARFLDATKELQEVIRKEAKQYYA